MKRCLLAVVIAFACAAPQAAAEELVRERLVLVRTTPGPASFTLTMTVETGQFHGFVGYVRARFENGRLKHAAPGAHTSVGRADDPGLRAFGDSWTTCTVGRCGFSKTWAGVMMAEWSDAGGPNADNAIFFVAEGEFVDVQFRGKGWALVKVPFNYRYVDGSEARAVSANAAANGAEVFLEATALGGAHGSIAQADPPCSASETNVGTRGAGQLTLDGGPNAPTVRCPQPSGGLHFTDFTTVATTWRVHGVAAGDSTLHATRLFVVDLPSLDPRSLLEPAPRDKPPADDQGPPPATGPAGSPAPPAPAAGPSAPAAAAPRPASAGCRPKVRARRAGRTVTVTARAAERCQLKLRLLAGRRVVARTSAVTPATVRMRAPRTGRLKLHIDAGGRQITANVRQVGL